MEEKALETIRTMLEKRKIRTETERYNIEIEKVSAYTVGPVLVIFSQKDKLLEKDIANYINYAEENQFTNGLIIVSLSTPSDAVLRLVKASAHKRVQFFFIKALQFDITRHRMASPHRILTEDEKTSFLKRFRISNPEQHMPLIDSQDAMAKYYGALPGDVVEIIRHSDVAGRPVAYRYCVADANLVH